MFLYAVQDSNGREICSATLDPEKVSDVTAELTSTGEQVDIINIDKVVASGPVVKGEKYTLHRWMADSKLEPSVKHPVR